MEAKERRRFLIVSQSFHFDTIITKQAAIIQKNGLFEYE